MDENLTPRTARERYFLSAEKGDVKAIKDILEKRQEYNLDIDCTDASGRSALHVALEHGNLGVIYPLLEHGVSIKDAVLRAVEHDFGEAVRILCASAHKLKDASARQRIIDCHCVNDDFHPDITPIILAAQRNNFQMVKILLENGVRIPQARAANFETAAKDSFQRSVGTIEIYKGLSSEAYVAMASKDPVDRAFTLSDEIRRLGETEIEFKVAYNALENDLEKCATEFIAQARSTDEIMTVLTHPDEGQEYPHSPLPKISRALDLGLQRFIAHPNCQQVIITQFYKRLLFVRDKSQFYRVLLFLLLFMFYPLLAVLHVYSSREKITSFVRIPIVMFIMYLASDLTFVGLLTYEAVNDHGEAHNPSFTRPHNMVALVWIIVKITKAYHYSSTTTFHHEDSNWRRNSSDGYKFTIVTSKRMSNALEQGMLWREIECAAARGLVKVMTQWEHIRDTLIILLFLLGVSFEIADYMTTEPTSVNGVRHVNLHTRARRSLDAPPSTIEQNFTDGKFNDIGDYVVDELMNTNPNLNASSKESIKLVVGRVLNYTARRRTGGKGSFNRDDIVKGRQDYIDGKYSEFLDRPWNHPQLMARATMALATAFTVLRMLPYVVISDLIGPLQISLVSMIINTFHFFIVVGAVLGSFAVGLTLIYSYYNDVEYQKCLLTAEVARNCEEGGFSSLFRTLITLYWSVFGLMPMSDLHLPDGDVVMETAGSFLYALFYVLLIIVLLNALIAVWSNVYNEIEENSDMQWKFSCTAMWMAYLQDDIRVPPPFVLLPTKGGIRRLIGLFSKRGRWSEIAVEEMNTLYDDKWLRTEGVRLFVDGSKKMSKQLEEQANYSRVISRLLDRYVIEKTAGACSTTGDITKIDLRNLKNDLIALRYDVFLKLCKVHDELVAVNNSCFHIRGKSDHVPSIYNKAEIISFNLIHNLHNTLDFQTSLADTVRNLHPPPAPSSPSTTVSIQPDTKQTIPTSIQPSTPPITPPTMQPVTPPSTPTPNTSTPSTSTPSTSTPSTSTPSTSTPSTSTPNSSTPSTSTPNSSTPPNTPSPPPPSQEARPPRPLGITPPVSRSPSPIVTERTRGTRRIVVKLVKQFETGQIGPSSRGDVSRRSSMASSTDTHFY